MRTVRAMALPPPPHRARLWHLPRFVATGARAYWRHPDALATSVRSRTIDPIVQPTRARRLRAAAMGGLWGATTAWLGIGIINPGQDIVASVWMPDRRWRVYARVAGAEVLVSALTVVVFILLGPMSYTGLGIFLAVICIAMLLLLRVERRVRRVLAPKRVRHMVSITGLASTNKGRRAATSFLRRELLVPWADAYDIPLYAGAASPPHVRLYQPLGFKPAPEHGPTALIRPPQALARSQGPTGRTADALPNPGGSSSAVPPPARFPL